MKLNIVFKLIEQQIKMESETNETEKKEELEYAAAQLKMFIECICESATTKAATEADTISTQSIFNYENILKFE